MDYGFIDIAFMSMSILQQFDNQMFKGGQDVKYGKMIYRSIHIEIILFEIIYKFEKKKTENYRWCLLEFRKLVGF